MYLLYTFMHIFVSLTFKLIISLNAQWTNRETDGQTSVA